MSLTPHPADGLGWRLGPARAAGLVVLLHGVGASGADLAPVAQAFCAARRDRVCVLLDGPEPFDGGGDGRQWFSIAGVTPQNRAQRVASVLPALAQRLATLTAAEDVSDANLTVLGFSQGAILTLGLAATGSAFGHGIAFSGRLSSEVLPPSPVSPRLWLSHGAADPVIPIAESTSAHQRLTAAGFDAVFTPVQRLGHTISRDQVDAAEAWLSA